MSLLFALAVGCSLDVVPIAYGDRCAIDREAVVGCVYDGDTFHLDDCDGETVRLLGVNTGELSESYPEAERCWGAEAAAWVTEQLTGQEVRLEFDVECFDEYERTLAYAYLPGAGDNGEDVLFNELLILEGHARVIYPPYDEIRLKDQLYAAEAIAEAAGGGIWDACPE